MGIGVLLDSARSRSYWKYALFSFSGAKAFLAVLGGLYLFVDLLDFFKIYTRDEYAAYAFLLFVAVSAVLTVLFRRPVRSTSIAFPDLGLIVEVRIDDIFDVAGAVMVSTNVDFETDITGGLIDPTSLQGQFTARYFTGDQRELRRQIESGLNELGLDTPCPMGTTVPITTHGKTFYFTAMARFNDSGNARTTEGDVLDALDGLWRHVRDAGQLQELAVPVVGTGRGRLVSSRKKMIGLISESFLRAAKLSKITERLVVVVRPEDARNFQVNLHEIRDHLVHLLKG